MTNSEMAQDRALTTERIAAAGRPDSTERASQGQYPQGDRQQPASATQAGVRADLRAADQAPAQLLEGDEMQSMFARWKDIQAEFVDEPRKAVQDADALVADLMQRAAGLRSGRPARDARRARLGQPAMAAGQRPSRRLPWATQRADILLRKEHAWVPMLAPLVPLPVPVPQRTGEPSKRFPRPWIVTTWVPPWRQTQPGSARPGCAAPCPYAVSRAG
jgi:hypothetical protein